MNQNEQKPVKVDNNYIAKTIAAGWVANTLTTIAIIVPSILLFVAFWFFALKKGAWLAGMAPNTRGILMFAVIVVPIFALSVFRNKIRNYFVRVFEK